MSPTHQTSPEWDDYAKKHAEFQRRRAALRVKIAHERRAVDGLLTEVENWHNAKAIRIYVSAVKASAKRNGSLADLAEWIGWATDQADRFDPFCVSPHSILDTPSDQYRELTLDEGFDDEGNIEHA